MNKQFGNRLASNRSFQETLKSALYLLKHSFTLIGKNTGIVRPTVYLAVLSLIMTSLFFAAMACFLSGSHIAVGIIALVVLLVVLVPLRFFIRTFLKAIQSWMSYLTITGRPITYPEARRHVKQHTRGLLLIGFVDMIVAKMTRTGSERSGIIGMISGLFLSALGEVWDLLNHYMIPAVVVEGKPLMQSLPEIKSIRESVPATLVGVFGIDFAGDTLRGLLFLPYLLILAIGTGLGYLLGPVFPSTSWTLGGHAVSWVPVLATLYLNIAIGGVLKACVESVKAIYFTIFYTTIMHEDQIPDAYREPLMGYLRMGAPDAAQTA
jgi:hypothetical protein